MDEERSTLFGNSRCKIETARHADKQAGKEFKNGSVRKERQEREKGPLSRRGVVILIEDRDPLLRYESRNGREKSKKKKRRESTKVRQQQTAAFLPLLSLLFSFLTHLNVV